jgi:streptogramin lyase
MSCHGVLDDRGRLYYATTDTDHALLAATAIPAAWLNEQLDDCRCRRQIVILDCCHSGAFAKGAKGVSALALQERFEGRGRVVLTASRATEYSFEGDRVLGDGVSSVFTDVLVQGLRSGDADRDGDGMVTVTELYDYAYEAVRARDARQTPMLWTYGAEGGLLVAQSARGPVIEPVPLSDELIALLESARPRLREGAVAELAELLAGPDPGRALTARACLERVAAEDIPRVAALARAALEGVVAAPPPSGATPPPAAPPPAAPPPAEPPHAKPGEPPTSPPPRRRPSRRALVVAGGLAVALAAVVLLVALPKKSDSDDDPSVPTSGPISLDGGPRGIASGGNTMWIALHDAGTVNWVDADSALASVHVGPYPETIAADDEGSVWATTHGGTELARINPEKYTITRVKNVFTRETGCVCASSDLVIAFGALWVGVPSKGEIVKRDLASGDRQDIKELPAGFEGRFAAAVPDELVLWAVGTTDDDNGPGWVGRVDPEHGKAPRLYDVKDIAHPSGVAFGASAVWIADDRRNTVVRFDPGTHRASAPIRIPDGVTSDDIVAVADAVLVWNPTDGRLTRIDPETRQVVRRIPVRGFRTGQQRNTLSSEIAVANGVAWVTDPAANRVFRVRY